MLVLCPVNSKHRKRPDRKWKDEIEEFVSKTWWRIDMFTTEGFGKGLYPTGD